MNEPDNQPIWEPHRYAIYLAAAAQEIRSLRKHAKILAPELGSGKAHSIDRMLKAINPEDFDILTAHPYGRMDYARLTVEYAKSINKPVWWTESGSNYWLPWVRPAHVRGDMAELLTMDGVEGMFVYALRDPDPKCKRYNMLDDELEPNAVYEAASESK